VPAPTLPAKSRRRSDLPGIIGLVLGSILVTLVLLELGLRAWSGIYLYKWPNFVLGAREALDKSEQSRFIDDPHLGYVPRPGYSVRGVSFDAEGFRRDGDIPASAAGGPIVAVGDSYTYGNEVTDTETWPAHLQELTDERVLNGGVSGYGFDQTVLRAESAAAAIHPSVIVVSFIADDIRRTEMRRLWGAEKPYFDLYGDRLALRNVPVPPRPDPSHTLDFWRRTLGYSYLVEFTVERLGLQYGWFGNHIRVHPAGTGERIACLLAGRLAKLQRTSGAAVLVVAQYDPYVWQNADFAAEQRRMSRGLLDCARQNQLGVLDTYDAVSAWTGKDGPRGLYGMWHMNDQGNRLTARLIAAALNKAVR
jgi:GDSL-like Lipase/Acylhydrolase family